MTHAIWDIGISAFIGLVGSLGHIVLTRLEARVDRLEDRLDKAEEKLSDIRENVAEARGRAAGHD